MNSKGNEAYQDADWLRFLPLWMRRRLIGRHLVQSIAGNSGWLLLDKAIRMGIGIVIGVAMARHLGPSQFGHLNLAIAFVALFTPFVMLGLEGIVVRDLVQESSQRNDILGAAFCLKLLGGLAGIVLVQVAVWFVNPTDVLTRILVGIIAGGLVFQCLDVLDYWYQSRTASKFVVFARSSAFLVCAAAKITLILLGADVIAFAWSTVAETILAALCLLYVYTRTERSVERRLVLWQWSRMRALLASSWPLFVSSVAVMVYFRMDQVMLAKLSGTIEVGLYSAALKLSEVWYTIGTVLVVSAAPSLAKAYGESESVYYYRLQLLFTTLARVAYAVIIPMSFLGSHIVRWLYGESYASAAPILAIHIWTMLFVFLGVVVSAWAVNHDRKKFLLGQTVIGAILNIALNTVLIPRFGGIGAAISTLISQALVNYLLLGLMKSTRRVFRIQTRALLLRT